jgi:hypothetical protein
MTQEFNKLALNNYSSHELTRPWAVVEYQFANIEWVMVYLVGNKCSASAQAREGVVVHTG